MDRYNLIIIGFIVAAVVIALWWTFNTIRRIDNQKNFCAIQLTSIAKLWRKAKFVPEDAKERESLYLYRDFLRKFDTDNGQYPVMVKDGKVRCMTRKEYDNLFGQKTIRAFSWLITAIALILAAGSIYVNVILTKTPLVGIALAVVLPILQLLLAIFVSRFNKEKNNYRDGIFLALKENSTAFLSVTKPFIVMDAYPAKFGKKQKPLYPTIGKLTEEQVAEVGDFIIRQKAAETKVVISEVDNEREITRLNKKTQKRPQENDVAVINVASEKTVKVQASESDQATLMVETEKTPTETIKKNAAKQKKIDLINQLADNIIHNEIKRAVLKVKKDEQVKQVAEQKLIDEVESMPSEPVKEVIVPAEDDFSLESIGQALDAEIARRKNR
ncbi:MAG: hypothetical protein J5580_02415 [Clostridia bacterium]|nr:hypothetical protein [Clostridia bacterium]